MSGGEAPGLPTYYVHAQTYPPAGYTPTHVPHVYACARCGGAVADVDVHDAWHAAMYAHCGL